nr:MAG: ORF1 [Giant panda anellovirus]
MAWIRRRWRRWRRPYYRRRTWRYRRYFRPQTTRRYYRRRRHPRVRKFFKKRAYVSSVVQWHPKHRTICKIRGWGVAMFGVSTNTTTNFQQWVDATKTNPGYYLYYGGGASLYHLTLDYLWTEHKKRHNIWTHTNEGYDLARYFGTLFTLWPHPKLDYIMWWETDYGSLRKTEMERLHPANLLLEKKHIVVRSIEHGGRKPKKVKIPPPAVHQSQWYFMRQWCDVGLVRFGFSLLNLVDPFLKPSQRYPQIIIGTSTGQETPDKLPNTVPKPSQSSPSIQYKWMWDDCTDNKIGWGQKKGGTEELLTVRITPIDIPYWMYYYGMGWRSFNTSDEHFFFIWWYEDKLTEEKYSVQELTNKKKQWILLKTHDMNYAELIVPMIQQTPFCYTKTGLPDKSDIFSIPFFYSSKWQWGGTSPQGESIVNPCEQPPTDNVSSRVRIRNPATVGDAMLHPWDLDSAGFITLSKLQQLVGHRGNNTTLTGSQEQQEEVQRKYSEIDSEPSTEETSSESTDWNSDEEAPTDPKNTYHLLTKRISRERRFRRKLRNRIKRLLKN